MFYKIHDGESNNMCLSRHHQSAVSDMSFLKMLTNEDKLRFVRNTEVVKTQEIHHLPLSSALSSSFITIKSQELVRPHKVTCLRFQNRESFDSTYPILLFQ